VLRLQLALGALALASVVACGQAVDHPTAAEPPAAEPAAGLAAPAAGEMEACVGVVASAESLPVDLFALVDSSSSMREATSTGVSKWYATKAALRDFLHSAPVGLGFGLSLFPTPGDDTASCVTQHYRDASLPIADVSQMSGGALDQLEAVTPQGQTPTAPALTAALELATDHALEHRDRSVVVVLATDGLPTTCDPVDVRALAELTRGALRGSAHVRTLVVASRSLTGSDQSSFDTIAAAGGTGRALSIDPRADFSAQLSQALGAAATKRVTCDLALPEPPRGERIDYDAVNVVLSAKGSRITFPRVEDAESCGAAGGWYYDVDPTLGAPFRLNMCKASCDRLSDTGAAELRVELGCRTVVH
jgi:hypothetical protein